MRQLKQILLMVSLVLIGGCTPESTAPLRLGTNVWPGYEPLYLARDLQLWPSDKIRLVEYPSATEVLRAFRNKSLEAASLTLDEVLQLRQLDIPVTVVLVHDVSAGADVIVASPEITSMKDLRGKRIGVESSALGGYVISRALEINGLSIADVEIKNIDVNMHEQAFKQGEVDAIVTFEPVRTLLLSAGANELFTSREISGEIVDVLAVHQAYLDKHPELVRQLIDGWFKALAYMDGNERDAAARMAERLKITPQEVIDSYQGLLLPDRKLNKQLLGGDSPELEETLTKLNRAMSKLGLLNGTVNTSGLLSAEFQPQEQ